MQVIRIYRKSGGQVKSFRPFFMNAEQLQAMHDKYPSEYFNWLH